MDTTQLSLAHLEINKIEALLELMFLAAYVDGEVSDAERAAFRQQIIKGTQGQLQADLVETILAHVEASLAGADRDKVLASIRERLREERVRRSALDIAATILRADGALDAAEIAFLGRAAKALDLDAGAVQAVLAKPAQ